MIKELFNIAVTLIFRPADAWKELNGKKTDDNESFLSGFVYPFIGMITIAAFVGILFTRKEFDLQIALKSAILALVSSFGGFFLAAWLLNETLRAMFHRERNMKLCQRFVGYASSLMFSLNILTSLLPEFFILRFLVLYTIYIVWEGAIPYMSATESEQLKFVGVSTAIIVLTPVILEQALGMMMPGLRL
ncbi:MAG: hypothetical protein LBT42_00070 [Tannerella sp.]|jgi:hypothetical protein|nr:hypothetical protein [Tannerella sp.]